MIEENSYWTNDKENNNLKSIGAKKNKDAFFVNNSFYKSNTVKRGLELIHASIHLL